LPHLIDDDVAVPVDALRSEITGIVKTMAAGLTGVSKTE